MENTQRVMGEGVGGYPRPRPKKKQVGKTHAYRCRPRRALEEESRLRQLVERGGAGPRPRPTLILTPEVLLTQGEEPFRIYCSIYICLDCQ